MSKVDEKKTKKPKRMNSEVNVIVKEDSLPEGYKGTVIMTHSGKFHCDEALACGFLLFLEKFKDALILRVSHRVISDELKKRAEVTVDIGGECNFETMVLDHHQKSFGDTFSEDFETKLASCGIVFKRYGEEIVSAIAAEQGIKLEDNLVKKLTVKMYESFVEHLDANDNGIAVSDGEMRYKISTSLSSRVGNLNPQWNDQDVDVNLRFLSAVNLVRGEFLEQLNYYLFHWLPARHLVEEFYSSRTHDGKIMELRGFCPWRGHLYDLEEERKEEGVCLFIIFKEEGKNGVWRYLCVGKKNEKFVNRLSPPKEWMGLRFEELEKVTGIKGCTFVHASGFTGGNKTKEGLVKMLEKVMASNEKKKEE